MCYEGQTIKLVKDSDKLFIISAVLIPVFLITINYPAIEDFYAYSVPINRLSIVHEVYHEGPETFEKISSEEGTTCFTSPSMNYFCYPKPRFHSNYGISYIFGKNGVDGEMHFEPVSLGTSYFTMQNMSRIDDNTVLITFADRDYRMGNATVTQYEITDKFEFSVVVHKFETFISNCSNYEGTDVNVVQFLGINKINGIDYFVTWHTVAESKDGVKCDYPQIIQHSIGHRFSDI